LKTKSKNIINSLIGSFGIQRDDIQNRDILMTLREKSYYYFWQFEGKALIREISTPNERHLHRIIGFEDVIRFDNNLPIRTQIVQ
jgi:hypothetical protein